MCIASLSEDMQALKSELDRKQERYEEMYWQLVKIRNTFSTTWQEKHDLDRVIAAAKEFIP